jgi:hypothetical protein
VSAQAGKTFTVNISVDPQGTTDYAEKIALKFPAGLLQVVSFAQAQNWMALPQSGYDLIDNGSGALVKTAGYPNGFKSSSNFGTVTFRVLKSGEGTISIGNDSRAFELNTDSAMTPSSGVAVEAFAPQVKMGATVSVPPKTSATLAASSTANTASSSLAEANVGTGGLHALDIWLIIIIIVLALILAYAVYRLRSKQEVR